MNEPRTHLARDLKALRYLDALNAGALEIVAALWEEASRDPELERALAEVDEALFAEHAEPRTHRPPGVLRRRWVWVTAVAAAASLLLLLARSAHRSVPPSPTGPPPQLADRPRPEPRETDVRIAAWREYRRALDGEDLAAFTWPLQSDAAPLGVRLDESRLPHSLDPKQSL